MERGKAVVIDASIAVKWYLPLSGFLNVPALTADDELIEKTRDPTLKHLSHL